MEKTEDSPIILAVDAGSRHLGFCAARGERCICSWQETVRGGTSGARIAHIARLFRQVLQRYRPSIVALEEPMGDHRNRRTDRVLGRVCGALEAAVALAPDADPPVRLLWINPSTVKATGFSKENPRAAARLVGKEEVSPDEADAIGVWQAALCQLQAERLERTAWH